MSIFGDVFSFEGNKLGNMWDKYQQDPERLFLGINTPFESKVWGSVLGKDYTPTVDMYGGATPDDISSAKAKGINTGPSESLHGIARGVVNAFAGGAAAGAMGGGASAGGGSGLLSSGGTAAEGMGGGTGITAGAGGQGFQAGAMGNSLYTSPSTTSPGLLTQATPYLNAAGKAAQTAQMTKGLLSNNQQPMQASPVMSGQGGGSQALTQLANQAQQQAQNELDQAAQQRMMRRQAIRGGL